MIKVSIILPIYNVAPYLEESLDSILNQTLKEIEIIAVNDGSTDNSEEIVKEYQQKDPRIIFFSQENQGQSVARNLALQHATGEYIYMMHSDDMLSSPDMLQTCYDYAEKNRADFIFFDRDWLVEDSTDFSVSLHSTKYAEENKVFYYFELEQYLLDKGYSISKSIRTQITDICSVDNKDNNHFCHKDYVEDYPEFSWRNPTQYGQTNWILNVIRDILNVNSPVEFSSLVAQLKEKDPS